MRNKTSDLVHAERLAQRAFKTRFQNMVIADDAKARLSLGSFREGRNWIFRMTLLPNENGIAGLKRDLETSRGVLIATISVDLNTGVCRVLEEPNARELLATR